MPRVRWGRVLGYLALVFILSWGLGFLLDGAAAAFGGRSGLFPPLGMFVPALVAIVLRAYLFEDSRIHRNRCQGPPARLLLLFPVLFLVQVGAAAMAMAPVIPEWIVRGVATWSMIAWTLFFIRLYRRHGEEIFASAGLQLGRVRTGFKLALGFVSFLLIQALLDYLFVPGRRILGTVPGLEVPIPDGSEPLVLGVAFVLTLVGAPLGNLPLVLGEEYGWRGYLQDELAPIGRRKAALLIGLIWGIWHVPIVWKGIHTFPPTRAGFMLAFTFFSLWGFIQSYAVLKTGSIWTAAILHGIVNGLYGFIRTYVFRPDDKILSFGLGLYGVICLAVAVLAVLRDSVWDDGGANTGR